MFDSVPNTPLSWFVQYATIQNIKWVTLSTDFHSVPDWSLAQQRDDLLKLHDRKIIAFLK